MVIENYMILLALLGPLSLLLYSGLCWLSSSRHDRDLPRGVNFVGFLGILVSFASVLLLVVHGAVQSPLLGLKGLGFSLRLDGLSMIMFSMITILSFVILRFSNNYLDGDKRKPVFFCRLAVTIAAVELLVLSGNLFQLLIFWAITSICLHYLLVFYRNRPQAIAAARKKFILARLGDVALLVATILIYLESGTGELPDIFAGIASAGSEGIYSGAAIFLVITAIFKSAQFPTHGWLIEVVETPTPVSALLHAGLLNAGPFLMVRLAYLMSGSTSASMLLIIIGGLTALFASVVYLTQPSIKVSLGYSSIAHMGFSLLLCGLEIYSAAILHIVAHSFYKAHAFLSSGSVVDVNRASKLAFDAKGNRAIKVIVSIAFALGIYVLALNLLGINAAEEFNLLAIGSIIAMGMSQVMASTLKTRLNARAIIISVGISLLVVVCFFSFEHVFSLLLGNQLPQLRAPNPSIKVAVVVLVSVYSIAMLLQLFAYKFSGSEFAFRWGVHLRNGLYVNVVFDRMIGSLKNDKFKWVNLAVEEEHFYESSLEHYKSMNQPEEKVIPSNSVKP